MFSAETITEFRKRFRELPQAQFDSLLAWVDTRDANNPSALLESQLKRATEEHRANPSGKGNSQPGDSRGSLRPDGSWDRTLVFASATERLLREYVAKTRADANACRAEMAAALGLTMEQANDLTKRERAK